MANPRTLQYNHRINIAYCKPHLLDRACKSKPKEVLNVEQQDIKIKMKQPREKKNQRRDKRKKGIFDNRKLDLQIENKL